MTCSGSRLYSYKAPHASSFTKPARCSLVRWITSTDGQFFGKEVQVFTTVAFHIIPLNYLVYREFLGKLLFYKRHMSCGQNLVHGASWSRVGPYRFCSDGNPMTLSILLWTYLVLSDTRRTCEGLVYNVGVQTHEMGGWILRIDY